MNVRNRIWEELRQAKANIICIQRYTDKVRRKSRIFNITIIICASTGALGGIYEQWIAVIASALIAVSSVLKALLPNFIQSEQELSELDRLMVFYAKYFNSLEKIWYEHEKKITDEQSIMKNFFALKAEECDPCSNLNKGIRKIPDDEMEQINAEANEYVERVYLNYGKD